LDTLAPSTSQASPDATRTSLTLRCWGTRGSIPSPGPRTTRYGGNTTCVEVRRGQRRLILDAGTGIRSLGLDLLGSGGTFQHIFLTHFHWDHIQGFPFFPPLYRPDTDLRIIGPEQGDIDARSLFAGQMGPVYFPVPFSVVSARMSFAHLGDEDWEIDGITLRTLRVRHPSHAVGYRIEAGNRVVCFIPDNEVEGEGYDTGADWRGRLVEFVRGADLLVHDAMYTDEEYADRVGWGHSTHRQALRLAEEAEVGKLLFFHHDPERSDADLEAIVGRLRDEALARGCPVAMDAAAEGFDIFLEER
jgi:phosphoribosyl 1,2-cyclic phosphodiesterase